MSRIVSGVAGGRTLASVPGDGTRPTTDRVKEALFSRLEAWDVLAGARVVDLYAGSGGLGVEAASRGAEAVTLVELAKRAVQTCKQNAATINAVRGRPVVSVVASTVQSFLDRAPADTVWDVTFLDPPYAVSEEELSKNLSRLGSLLSPEGLVVVERSSRTPEPGWGPQLAGFESKKYGETTLWFAQPVRPD